MALRPHTPAFFFACACVSEAIPNLRCLRGDRKPFSWDGQQHCSLRWDQTPLGERNEAGKIQLVLYLLSTSNVKSNNMLLES